MPCTEKVLAYWLRLITLQYVRFIVFYTYRKIAMKNNETKLTLKLDKDVITSMKEYARKRSSSVSRLTEEYFRLVLVEDRRRGKYSPLVQELSGVLASDDAGGTKDKEEYISYLEKKYE